MSLKDLYICLTRRQHLSVGHREVAMWGQDRNIPMDFKEKEKAFTTSFNISSPSGGIQRVKNREKVEKDLEISIHSKVQGGA